METQPKLENINLEDIEIGTKESLKLSPAKVKIIKTSVEVYGDKGSKKLVCEVKHPNAEKTIKVSAAKTENKGKLETKGLWVNLDDENLLRKNSTLARLINFIGARNIKGLIDKEVLTIEDDSGYLVFKAY